MKCLRLWTLILLLFLGIGGFVGSVPMIVAPYWTQWGLMPVSLLRYSPFHSWFIPGVILLLSNALLPIWVYLRVKRSQSLSGLWTVFQGCVLLGFETVECLMLRVVAWPHLLYIAIALLLILCGVRLHRQAERLLPVSPRTVF